MQSDWHELHAILHRSFREVVGVQVDAPNTEPVDVEGFAHGDISSGMVDLQTWRERLIPLLIDRSSLLTGTRPTYSGAGLVAG